MKKLIFAILMSLIFHQNLQAGVPTIDVAAVAQQAMSYAQMLKDYAQQIKNYEQMIKDTVNFEKQMDELGVGMKDINQILGDAQGIIDNIQSAYNDINAIPQDFLNTISQIQDTCDFLESQSQSFSNKMQKIKQIKNKINRCISLVSNREEIEEVLEDLSKKMNSTTNYEEFKEIETQMKNIEKANIFFKQKQNIENANQILAFYDTYKAGEKNNPYSKESMTNDLKYLSSQLKKPNNQKQAQALTNSILIKILESLQRQYELNMEYTKTLTQLNQSSNGYNKVKADFKKAYEAPKFKEELFGKTNTNLPKDEFGLPIFTIK